MIRTFLQFLEAIEDFDLNAPRKTYPNTPRGKEEYLGDRKIRSFARSRWRQSFPHAKGLNPEGPWAVWSYDHPSHYLFGRFDTEQNAKNAADLYQRALGMSGHLHVTPIQDYEDDVALDNEED